MPLLYQCPCSGMGVWKAYYNLNEQLETSFFHFYLPTSLYLCLVCFSDEFYLFILGFFGLTPWDKVSYWLEPEWLS